MQTFVWTPRLFLTACALAIGVVAQASPEGGASDATAPDDSGTQDSATQDDGASADACPGTGNTYNTTGANEWPGPPSNDGSLDDGYMAPFTLNSGNALEYLGICTTLPTPYSYTTVKPAYADAAGCMAFNNQGHKASHDCLCQKCFSLMQQCDSLSACQAIWKCSQDSGCTNANSCYLIGNGAGAPPCVAVINAAGTGSVSTGMESNLGTCGTNNGCPAQ
jgi:hypothetical protein